MSRYIKKAKIPGVSSSSDGGDFQAVTAVTIDATTIEASSMKTTSFKSDYMEVPQSRIRVNEGDNFTRVEGNRWVVIDRAEDITDSVQCIQWTGQNFSQYDELQLSWCVDKTSQCCWWDCVSFGTSSCLFYGCNGYYHTSSGQGNCYTTLRCSCANQYYLCIGGSCSGCANCSKSYVMNITPMPRSCCTFIGGTWKNKAFSAQGDCHTYQGNDYLFFVCDGCCCTGNSPGTKLWWDNFDQMQLRIHCCQRPIWGGYELLGKLKSTGPSCIEGE